MSSKTSIKWFWHFILLFAMIATGFGCGSGGGGGNSGGNNDPGQNDANPPRFAGLTGIVSPSNTGNVELTADEASDGETPKEQLVYLIYASTTFPVDQAAITPYTFNGVDSCSGGQCRFVVTDLNKDGNTTYYFSSRARDGAGNVDRDPHPTEENSSFSVTPLKFSGIGDDGGNPLGSSLNVDPARHAVHPALAVVQGTPYVIWEECAPPSQPNPSGLASDHPCNLDEPSKIYVKRWNGSSWELVTEGTGQDDLNKNDTAHSHSPTITADQNEIYVAWREIGQNLFIQKFNGTQWTPISTLGNTGFGGDRPALTRHIAMGSLLGIAYEFSPQTVDHRQIFFRQWDGSAWTPSGTTLNKNPDEAGEAPIFSRNGQELYMTWKESTVTTPLATGGHSHTIPNIFVRKLNGANWDLIGDSLNINPANEARYPSIDLRDNVPYVAWHECLQASCSDEHIFVKHWDGGQWVQDKDTGNCPSIPDCGSLNHVSDGNKIPSRFAMTPSLSTFGNRIFVAWSERDDDTSPPTYKIRLKSLNGGGKWDFNGTLSSRNSYSPALYSDGQGLFVAWVEENEAGRLQLHVARN
ncbi:hypothetical protein [Candidatus Manganitrophus noduliformans]|uniref:Exo-alpha-sialidase n=1 Tax=Candidatus Manganitrophus noduliformans TaxID=2606439 RepID=A0A7X6IAK8_9BACT|nr:hypothetical protein [Candidatus Manganitrophus noduliformans]NKE70643.1 hypothetical protein [Candidatus Manganitrophus noduliformans]